MKMSNKFLAILLLLSFAAIVPVNAAGVEDYGIIEEEQQTEVQQEPQDSEDPEVQAQTDNSDDVELDVSKIKVQKVTNGVNQDAIDEADDNAEVKTSQPQAKNQDLYDTDSAYKKRSTSYKKSKKFKKGEVGAKYDTTFTPDSASQTRTLYSDYNLNDKTKINTSYSNNTTGTPAQQMKGTVSVAPEYRINKKLSVQNKFSKNLGTGSTKEEVSVKINPFKDSDRMDINAGAGQVQYTNGAPSSSQINFGTNFRF